MMDDNLQHEDLVRYIDNEMTETERAALDKALVENAPLRRQLATLRLALEAITVYGASKAVAEVHSQMMNELKQLETITLTSVDNYKNAAPVRRIKPATYMWSVAATLILAVVCWQLLQTFGSGSDVYNEVYVSYQVPVSRGAAAEKSYVEQLYVNNQWATVITEKAKATSAHDSLLVAVSLLNTGAAAEAITWLRPLTRYKNSVVQDAEFYLALAHIKNENWREAERLVKKIVADKNHVYQGQFSEGVQKKVARLSK